MKAYKIFNYQRDVLVQQNIKDGTKYNPVMDINGTWFISQEEYSNCGLGVLSDFIPPEPEMI